MKQQNFGIDLTDWINSVNTMLINDQQLAKKIIEIIPMAVIDGLFNVPEETVLQFIAMRFPEAMPDSYQSVAIIALKALLNNKLYIEFSTIDKMENALHPIGYKGNVLMFICQPASWAFIRPAELKQLG